MSDKHEPCQTSAGSGCSEAPPFFAVVDGKLMHLPGDTRKEAVDLVKLSWWLAGLKPPKIVFHPNNDSPPIGRITP
jgi:hypothetical protein